MEAPLPGWLYELQAPGFCRCLGATLDIELCEDVAHMGLHGRKLDAEKSADFGTAPVLADEAR